MYFEENINITFHLFFFFQKNKCYIKYTNKYSKALEIILTLINLIFRVKSSIKNKQVHYSKSRHNFKSTFKIMTANFLTEQMKMLLRLTLYQ